MSVYHRPDKLADALALLSREPTLTVLAGGTDVYPARASRKAWGACDAARILDISKISSLHGIDERRESWRIGTLTTWRDLIRASLPAQFDGLKSAAREIGGAQVQSLGTIGGNCCTASPAADGIPCLLALDAEFEIAGPHARLVPAQDFFVGYRKTVLGPGELLAAVHIPKLPGRTMFRKLGARRYLVISIAMVALTIDLDEAHIVHDAIIAVGACSATAQRLPALERSLRGKRLSPASVQPHHLDALAPIDDIRASAAYRRHAALTLLRDCFASLTGARSSEALHG
jgi:CO/xanthine dehydrogenase FAD-binding subunit